MTDGSRRRAVLESMAPTDHLESVRLRAEAPAPNLIRAAVEFMTHLGSTPPTLVGGALRAEPYYTALPIELRTACTHACGIHGPLQYGVDGARIPMRL